MNNPSTSLWTWLWNPFHRIAGWTSLAAGIAVLLATGFLAAPTNTHFDGVLDTHTGFRAPLWLFLAEHFVNWLSLSAVLWTAGALLKGPRSFRAIDLFGTQALARWPFLITALACYLPGFESMNRKLIQTVKSGQLVPQATAMEWFAFTCVTTVMIVMTVWFVALAWKSYRVSCDVRGAKAVIAFVVGIIVAEVISKIALGMVFFPLAK